MWKIKSSPGKKLKLLQLEFTSNGCQLAVVLLPFLFIVGSCNHTTIIYPERKDLIEAVYASGIMMAEHEHILQAVSNGKVIEKWVHEGDTVKKGQLLYTLSREMPGMKVKSSGKGNTIQNLSGLSLVVTGAPPTEDKSYIRSDIDGVVYQTNKEAGESVHAYEPLVLLGSRSSHFARLSVDQMDVTKIIIGQLVLLKSDLTGDIIYEGMVDKIYPLMNEANQSFNVDVLFKNKIDLPFIHNSVEGNIVIQKKENALVLPAYALSEGDSLSIDIDGRRKNVKIKTGIRGINFIEITEGIDDKTSVFVDKKK